MPRSNIAKLNSTFEQLPSNLLHNTIAIVIVLLSACVAIVQYQNELIQMRILGLRAEHLTGTLNLVNEWNFFQAKNNRAIINELGQNLIPDKRSQYRESVERYSREKEQIKARAHSLQDNLGAMNMSITECAKIRAKLLFIAVILQLAISLSSISLLFRRNSIYLAVLAFSATSIAIALTTVILNLSSGVF